MLKNRVIVVLLWTRRGLVQSRQFKHTNIVGNMKVAINSFTNWGVDELVVLNVERTDENFEKFCEDVKYLSEKSFIPLSVGGWVTSLDRAEQLLKSGADRIVLNSVLHNDIREFRKIFNKIGKANIIVCIDYKTEKNVSKILIDRGRDVLKMSSQDLLDLLTRENVGEVLVQSIDKDGTGKGYDLKFISEFRKLYASSIIILGGVGKWEHMALALDLKVNAVAAANIFHYIDQSVLQAKNYLIKKGYNVRIFDYSVKL